MFLEFEIFCKKNLTRDIHSDIIFKSLVRQSTKTDKKIRKLRKKSKKQLTETGRYGKLPKLLLRTDSSETGNEH